MSNTQLDAFLAGKPAPDDAPAEPPQAAEPAAAPTPAPETPEAPQAAPEASAEPSQAEPEHDAEPNNFRKLREVTETYKREREDWKSRAVRAETERDEVRKQFEAAQRAPVQPQPGQPGMAPPPQLDIREAMAADPSIKAAVLTRLDTSEMLLRRELGDEPVNQLQADFTEAMAADPSLQARVLTQRDPYRWAHKHMEAIRLQRAIGDDPAAYRAQLRAELEAEIMAGRTNGGGNGAAPRVSPAAGMAPSLAQARSAAPRSGPGATWSGPTPLDAILGGRK